jgi:hypothetical protein
MYHFRMSGIIKDSYDEKPLEVLFKDGKLSGDKTLVQELKVHPDYGDEAEDVILLMHEICDHGQIWGNYLDWLP